MTLLFENLYCSNAAMEAAWLILTWMRCGLWAEPRSSRAGPHHFFVLTVCPHECRQMAINT